jgi:two-component system chemotaxis response regulator CheB
LKKIKEYGGFALAQNPATAESHVMPRAALAATEVDEIAPLEEIGNRLVEICKEIRS